MYILLVYPALGSLHIDSVCFFWASTWTLACSWTPKPFNTFRLFILRLFGASIHSTAFVHQRARIDHP